MFHKKKDKRSFYFPEIIKRICINNTKFMKIFKKILTAIALMSGQFMLSR
jgi:hypothetical protein